MNQMTIDQTSQCRICQAADLRNKFQVNGFHLVSCQHCGFQQINDKPSLEDLREIYNESYFTHQKYADQKTLDRENCRRLNLMQKYSKHGKALDVGCATGDFIRYAQDKYQFYGFDFSPEAIEIAQTSNPALKHRVWVGGIDKIPEKNLQFDVICMWDVIEHLWDPLAECRALFTHLKAGGYFVISTPKIDSLSGNLLGKKWHFMTPPEHLSFLTKNSIAVLADKLNAKVVKHMSRGKWANVGFIFRKFKRKFSFLVPNILISLLNKEPFRRLSLYVPTNDIQYVVFQKK